MARRSEGEEETRRTKRIRNKVRIIIRRKKKEWKELKGRNT